MNWSGPLSRKLARGGDVQSLRPSITLTTYPASHLVCREKDMNVLTSIQANWSLCSFLSLSFVQFSSVQLLSCVGLSATPWTAAHQASLSITNSQNLLKLMSVMPSNHLILCGPPLLPPSIFPSIRVFPLSQFFASGGQSIGVSASASVFPMNIQC